MARARRPTTWPALDGDDAPPEPEDGCARNEERRRDAPDRRARRGLAVDWKLGRRDKVWAIACVADDKARERDGVDAMNALLSGAAAVPDEITDEVRPALAGRALRIPPGGEAVSDRIRCDDGATQMSWQEATSETVAEKHGEMVEPVRSVPGAVVGPPERADCVLDGSSGPTTCTYIVLRATDEVHVYVASGPLRDRHVVLVCSFQNQPRDQIGDACKEVLTVRGVFGPDRK